MVVVPASVGVLLGAERQEQRRTERVSVHRGKGDIVDENVVEPSLTHRDFPHALARSSANAN
jgi:hypothetical protein